MVAGGCALGSHTKLTLSPWVALVLCGRRVNDGNDGAPDREQETEYADV